MVKTHGSFCKLQEIINDYKQVSHSLNSKFKKVILYIKRIYYFTEQRVLALCIFYIHQAQHYLCNVIIMNKLINDKAK